MISCLPRSASEKKHGQQQSNSFSAWIMRVHCRKQEKSSKTKGRHVESGKRPFPFPFAGGCTPDGACPVALRISTCNFILRGLSAPRFHPPASGTSLQSSTAHCLSTDAPLFDASIVGSMTGRKEVDCEPFEPIDMINIERLLTEINHARLEIFFLDHFRDVFKIFIIKVNME